MAKYTTTVKGDFDHFAAYLEKTILEGSISATLEDSERIRVGGAPCLFQVYERYSYAGGNRLSLSVVVAQQEPGTLSVTGITAGGSQAVFFKINTWGEESFLDKLREAVERYRSVSGSR